MAKKKKDTIPSGFDNILGNIYSNAEQGEGVTDLDNVPGFEQPLVEDEEDNEPPVNTEDGNEQKTDDTKTTEDDSDIPPEVIDRMNDNTEDTTEDDESEEEEISNADVVEAQQVGLLFDAVGQSLGWNMNDIDEKDRPLTVEDLTNYWVEAIKQNSVPHYADDRIQQLDEYVKNGGKFEDFYSVQQEALTLDNIDMEDETNQKAVIRELLKYNNYTDEQINKKISRYEDNDMLYEESEDALDRLKNIRQKELEESTRQQEEYARQQEEQSKAFFQDVTQNIKSLTDIRGIAIPKEDRQALFDYIFKVDQDGVS